MKTLPPVKVAAGLAADDRVVKLSAEPWVMVKAFFARSRAHVTSPPNVW
jgi:hypothetical protein